nr:uncharacterized protein LOC106689607 isoform X3 [Halyomorpha halys]
MFNLMMILSPLQWAHLILLESDAINEIKNSNIRHCQYNDDKMCEMVKELWLKGNIVASFIQFSSLYDKEDKNFQTKLIKTLQGLICLSVDKGGMAIVANITEHVKKFSHEKNEMSVLVTLWYALFNSSLYDDNCLSDTLLEDPNFKAYLEPLIPCFGADFLKHNEVGSYQRLIETSLTHNLDNAAGMLLRLLFNYYYKKGYFSGCSAVYECCIVLKIKLTKDQIYKYNLLKKTGVKIKRCQEMNHPKDFTYKF